MKKILIIEDSQNIADLIKIYMKDYFTLFHADTGEEGLSIFHKEQIDLVLLDLVLPGMSGLEVLGEIRKTSTTPIIILSSKNLDMDKILGLKMGADDYVTKPFNPLELQARVEAQIRRNQFSSPLPDECIQYENLRLAVNNLEVYRDDEKIPLLPIEYKMLRFFIENPRTVFTKKQIYEAVWEDEYAYDDNTVMVHISKLKKKINIPEKAFVKTIRGLGYRFEK